MGSKREPLTHMERLIGQAIGNEREIGLPDDPARETMPALWAWLTTIYVGKDYVKQPATLRITMGPEGCLVSLTDVDLAQSMECSCPFLSGVLEALERVLSSPNPPFKPFGKKQPTLRKRKTIS